MPGIERLSVDDLLRECETLARLSIPGHRPVPGRPGGKKDPGCARILESRRASPRRRSGPSKRNFPSSGVITDVALDPFTTHGQDGLIDEPGYVHERSDGETLVRQARSHADAGADVVAPSDMMDGRIGAIRACIRDAPDWSTRGFWPMRPNTPRASTVRFARPWARPGSSAGGSKHTYQMDPGQFRRGAARSRPGYRRGRRHGHDQARDCPISTSCGGSRIGSPCRRSSIR